MSNSESFQVPARDVTGDDEPELEGPQDSEFVEEAARASAEEQAERQEQARQNQSLKQRLQEERAKPEHALSIELYGQDVPFKSPTADELQGIRSLATDLEDEQDEGAAEREQSDAVFDAADDLAEQLAAFCLDESMQTADDWRETFGINAILEIAGLLVSKGDEDALSQEDREQLDGFR